MLCEKMRGAELIDAAAGKAREDLEFDAAIKESLSFTNEEERKRELQEREEHKMLEVNLRVKHRKL